MRILSVPARLRGLATSIVALSIFFIAIEVILIKGESVWWWHPPVRLLEIWTSAVALIFIPIAWALCMGRRWALYASGVFGLIWCAITAWAAFRYRNPSLGFFLVFLALFWVVCWVSLQAEMDRTFINPRTRWYQGAPRVISGLTCRLKKGEEWYPYGVSRIDEDGLFLVNRTQPAQKRQELATFGAMELTYREQTVRCSARAISVLEDGPEAWVAAGFKFHQLSPDDRKKLGDFVENLRGEGHVG